MQKKKPFVLRLHPEMMEALEKWAADEFRSVNGQIESILHKALSENKRLKKSQSSNKPPTTTQNESNGNGI
ncbi:MAG TPA: Arc family DNA binding domain-containing protein [Bacteroidales bacterium]|nr:Arc family DNA binding domain-containing protein [Bacteroidales bacterium]